MSPVAVGVVALSAPVTSVLTYSKLAMSASLFVRFTVVPSFPAPGMVWALGVALPVGVYNSVLPPTS